MPKQYFQRQLRGNALFGINKDEVVEIFEHEGQWPCFKDNYGKIKHISFENMKYWKEVFLKFKNKPVWPEWL